MEFDKKLVADRLKEVFGDESQEAIAKKLCMSQGNVSKILNGAQLPAIDTLYKISNEYGVSVDWILGLSFERDIPQIALSYSDILKTFIRFRKYNMIYPVELSSTHFGIVSDYPVVESFGVPDLIVQSILSEWAKMKDLDDDIYLMWVEKRLKEYSEIPYIPWSDRIESLYNREFGNRRITPELLKEFYTDYIKNKAIED